MSVLDGPGEGTWSVFAAKVVAERDELQHQLTKLREQLEATQRIAADRMVRIERLKTQIRREGWKPLEDGYNLREQLGAALERSALECQRADMLHAALNALARHAPSAGYGVGHVSGALLDDADEALRLSRSRRAALLVSCRCGTSYGLEEWVALPSRGLQEQVDLPGDPLELRNCSVCRSTIALPLRRLPVTK